MIKTSWDPRTRTGKFMWAGIAAILFGISQIPQPPKAEREAYTRQATAAAKLEQSTADLCEASIRFEHQRAKPGFTRVARALPNGSFLIVQPFKIGKLERSARCVGYLNGDFEFTVEGPLT